MSKQSQAITFLSFISGVVMILFSLMSPPLLAEKHTPDVNIANNDKTNSSLELQQRSALIIKMQQAMDFIGGYRTLDDLKELGVYDQEQQYVPNKLFEPSLKTDLCKNDNCIMTLVKKGKGLPWTSVIFFPGGNYEDVSLPDNAYSNDLGLSFISVEKIDFNNRVFYKYKYQWNRNPRVFVMLKVESKFFVPNQKFPDKFYFVEVSRVE